MDLTNRTSHESEVPQSAPMRGSSPNGPRCFDISGRSAVIRRRIEDETYLDRDPEKLAAVVDRLLDELFGDVRVERRGYAPIERIIH